MKKIILLALTVSGLNNMSAQNESIPPKVKGPKDTVFTPAVTAEDPMNKASWKRNGKNDKAEFSDTTLNKERTVTYDATGNMVISENSSDQASNVYPPAIAEYYTQKFPNEKYRVLWTKDKIGNKVYYISRKSEVYWFDQDGKFKNKTRSNPK